MNTKYLKSLFIAMVFSSFLNADYLNLKTGECVDDYYFKTIPRSFTYFYYSTSSSSSYYYSIVDSNFTLNMLDGYDYNSTDYSCRVSVSKRLFDIKSEDFNFLMALSGLIFSSIIFVILANFLTGM